MKILPFAALFVLCASSFVSAAPAHNSAKKPTGQKKNGLASQTREKRLAAQRLLEQSLEDQNVVGVQKALARGADPNKANNGGQTPLEIAYMSSDWESANLLRLRGARLDKVGPKLLISAAGAGDTELVRRLLKAGVKRPNLTDWNDNSLLVATVSGFEDGTDEEAPRTNEEETQEEERRLPILQALLAAGENPSKRDPNGQLPLQAAAALGRTRLVKLLLDKGAPINATNKRGFTALFEATPFPVRSLRHRATRALLFSRGADVNITNTRFGMTPFHYAVREGRDDLVREFLSHGAQINKPQKDGQTPLITAMREARVATARVLLENGADTSAKDESGKTALDYEKQGIGDTEAQREVEVGTSPSVVPEFFDEALNGQINDKFWTDIAKRRGQIAALIKATSGQQKR